MTSCGDDGGANTSWTSVGSATNVTSAGISAGTTEQGSTAAVVPTDGSASDAEGASAGTSPVSGTTGDSTTGAATTSGATSTTSTTEVHTTGAAPGNDGLGGETTEGEAGCKQVDFLFVIDDSLSMEGEQAALTAAFPAFLATIENTLPTSDYHIMVVDTDAASRCGPGNCSHETCQAAGKHACMNIFDECDQTRGAGVVHPAGAFAANKACDFEPGKRYLLSSDPQLNANFKCAAEVGTAGDPKERPMDAMVEAVSAELRAPGACNDGFLRDDAILVVTFITDDDGVEDINTAQQTYDALVAAKGGDADRIVMLGLIPGNGCAKGGLHWAQLIGLFGMQGIQGEVCNPDYNAFFQNAVATILETCVVNPG
ncbi:MAG: hypothetical protein H0T76_07535 [Nannocystis sp.]|nr:hypothetical protein [Nannocystis sp.]MBA3546316.1 hypothetical protein [Nannocystis sp.]